MSKEFSDSNILQDIVDQIEREYVFYMKNVAFTSDYIIVIRSDKVTPEFVEDFVKGLKD